MRPIETMQRDGLTSTFCIIAASLVHSVQGYATFCVILVVQFQILNLIWQELPLLGTIFYSATSSSSDSGEVI